MSTKRFFSAAAYMAADGHAPELVSLMIQAPDDTQAEAELLWKLADTYPFSQVQATAIREVSVSMENSIAAKVCANLSELQIPETVRNALFVERAAE